MRISMLSTLPPTKGLSPYTLNLVRELSKKCEVDFYGFKSIYPEFLYPGGTKTDEQEPTIKNVEIYNYLTWYNPFSWIKTGFSIKTDIIHVQWWSWLLAPIYLITLSIAKLQGKRIIMTVHNVKPHERSFIKNALNSSVIGLADEYIVHSENNRKTFIELKNTKKEIHVIPHGVLNMKKSMMPSFILRKKYGFSNKDQIILFFGNIRDYKGLDVLILAFAKLKEDNMKLIIAGEPWNGFEKYQELIDKFNLNKKVKLLLKFNSDKTVAELFKISDVVVYPYTHFESSSGAAALALNFDKPMIVTNVGGLSEVVKDKNVIAKPDNSEDLAKKINYAFKNLINLKKDSREMAKKFFWKNIAEKTMEVYEK